MTNTTEQTLSYESSQSILVARIKTWMAHTIPVAALVLALWLPFGFSLTGLIEEWGLLGIFTTHGIFFLTDTSSPLAAHALRPLTILPQAIAYYLDPYSFTSWNILLAISLCVKGTSLSYITNYITDSLKWGVIAGLLIIIYPADTMQLSFRALHINWALSLIMLGTALFIASLSYKSKIASYSQGILSAILLSAACAMYEASLVLVAFPILVIFAKSGVKSTIRQIREKLWKHITWLSGALAYIAYVIHTAPHIKSYQSSISGSSAIETIVNSFPNLFSTGLLRTTLGGWYDAAAITTLEFNTYWYAIITLIIVTIIFISLTPRQNIEYATTSKSTPHTAFCLFVSGVLLALLGYFPFLLSLSHQLISQRTFLFASPGGIFVTLAVLIAISKANKHLAICFTAFLAFIGFSTQLYQFHHYVSLSERQRSVMKNIVEQFNGKIDDKTLFIIDKTNQLNHTWMFINENLQAALNYYYGHTFNKMEICHEHGNEWQRTDNLSRKGICEETATEWILHYPTPVSGPGMDQSPLIEDKKLSKSDTAIITVDPDDPSLLDVNRIDMLRNDSGREGTIYRGFIDKPEYHNSLVSFTDQIPSDHYVWKFGNWWSMELPTAGSGWREAIWTVNKFHHTASAWKTAKEASLDFNFSPLESHYHLQGEFDIFANPTIRTSMKIEINGLNIPFEWKNESRFEAKLLKNQLKEGKNTINFISDTDEKYYGLAGRLDWVEIKK